MSVSEGGDRMDSVVGVVVPCVVGVVRGTVPVEDVVVVVDTRVVVEGEVVEVATGGTLDVVVEAVVEAVAIFTGKKNHLFSFSHKIKKFDAKHWRWIRLNCHHL